MTSIEERKRQLALSNAYLGGELILGVKYHHNSFVEFTDSRGKRTEGHIVSVGPVEPEPIYTVERNDGGPDEEVLESAIRVLFDPHEE